MLSAWERRVVNAKNRKRARRKDRRKSEGKKRAKISLTTIKHGRLMTHTHTHTYTYRKQESNSISYQCIMGLTIEIFPHTQKPSQ